MLDARIRPLLGPSLDRAATWLDVRWVTPNRLTLAGLVVGLGSATAAGARWWAVALTLWLLSRLLDGLDGPLARRRGGGDPFGGFADIVADFLVYGAFIVGMAIGTGAWIPFLVVLLAYYVNGAAFLAFSSIAERESRQIDDGRSLSFLGGLTEGTETVLACSLFCLLPQYAAPMAWVWAAAVTVTALQRVVLARRTLTGGAVQP
ncbi:CDP-alcohol phosphatidyltransferase family protein [Amycolatopsis sp. H20-H5]|uniref:CDP-alcohol phosphatidyltransferase family protein n=1 Tax=Amycolatopsis sp. H20-H5 TaxID=3046309 RepID=UPI002DBD57C7|nr:CDP-alcohol phosphatidyltransferase family protein [Amycolatopsis sp. H20-H5]MEC3975846.1 CDP-alcohol phosphatidyltransferase family protein [Amycolatopsis sp. H20-H5]